MGVLRADNPDDTIIKYCHKIRKTLGKDTGRLGVFDIGAYQNGSKMSDGYEHNGIYQIRNLKEGRVSIRLSYPKKQPLAYTPAQETNRTKIKNAVLAWQGLTDQEKESYNKRAIVKKISGYMLFIKEYMLS